MATTPMSKISQETEFDDVSLHSDSISSDGSYDFADDAIGGKAMSHMDLPNYRKSSTTAAGPSSNISNRHDPKDSGKSRLSMLQQAEEVVTTSSNTSPSSEEGRYEKEKQYVKWLQESPMTTGDTDVESVVTGDSNIILDVEASDLKAAFRKQDPKTQQKLAELIAAIETRNKIIQKLLENDNKYMTLLEKTHEEKVVQLKEKHREQINATFEETIQAFRLNEDNWMKHVKKEQGKKLQSTTVQYEAIIAAKDEERMRYKKAISAFQQTYDEYVTVLKRQHEKELNKTTDEFQSILASKIQKQVVCAGKGLQKIHVTLQAQKGAEIDRLRSTEMRYKEIQEQYQIRLERQLRQSNYISLLDDSPEIMNLKRAANLAQAQFVDQQAARMLGVHQTIFQAKYEKVNPEGECERLPFSTLNRRRPHEQDLQEADKIIDQVKNLKQQLNASEAKVKHLEGILGKEQATMIAKYATLEQELEQRDVHELHMVVHHAEQRAASAEAELRGVGQDIEEYIEQHKARDLNVMIDRVTGIGARKGLDSVFWLLGTEWQRLTLEIHRRREAEKKLREIEDDVEDILFCGGYY